MIFVTSEHTQSEKEANVLTSGSSADFTSHYGVALPVTVFSLTHIGLLLRSRCSVTTYFFTPDSLITQTGVPYVIRLFFHLVTQLTILNDTTSYTAAFPFINSSWKRSHLFGLIVPS